MEKNNLLSPSEVQSAVFIYTQSIIFIVRFSHLFILYFCLDCPCWNFFILWGAANPFNCVQLVAAKAS